MDYEIGVALLVLIINKVVMIRMRIIVLIPVWYCIMHYREIHLFVGNPISVMLRRHWGIKCCRTDVDSLQIRRGNPNLKPICVITQS